jgi:hypothetical protein
MYQCTLPATHLPVAIRSGWGAAALVVGLCAGGLALTNPGPADFEHFAADQLVDVLEEEVCRGDVLPTLVRMALRDCPGVVRAQRRAIAALVGRHSQRSDLGLLSVYRSRLGGHQLFGWRVPRFDATVVGAAGHFVILRAGVEEGPRRDAL